MEENKNIKDSNKSNNESNKDNNDKMPDSSSSASAPPASDWEFLSMSMTDSVSDLKSALAAVEAESETDDGSISEAALHSQYFGQIMAKVLPGALPQEIFPQEEEGDKQIEQPVDPQPAKTEEEVVAPAVVETETVSPATEVKCEIEQQILLSSVPVASETEEGLYGVAEVSKVTEKKNDDGVVTSEAETVAVVVDSGAVKESKAAWAKRHMQLAVDKVNRNNALWSIAIAAGVTGAIILGRRWYNEKTRALDVLEMEPLEEKVSELAQEIYEVIEPDLQEVSESADSQQPSSSWFGSLRDLW